MALITDNKKIGNGIYLLEVEGRFKGSPGQFYMIQVAETYPLLSRPISIFELTGNKLKFLYRIAGEGTRLLSEKKGGECIGLRGPYGNGYPSVKGKIAVVGGGMGAAPLYETCKRLKEHPDITAVDLYLGFSEEIILKNEWEKVCSSFFYDIGGMITKHVDVADYDAVLACGPDIMMKKLTETGKKHGKKVYVSIESRMGCGIGACLSCSCKTANGNKKVCKDGPVFLGVEIYDL